MPPQHELSKRVKLLAASLVRRQKERAAQRAKEEDASERQAEEQAVAREEPQTGDAEDRMFCAVTPCMSLVPIAQLP